MLSFHFNAFLSLELSFHRSISPTFYEQLLGAQIPNAQKETDDFTVFFSLLGSAPTKAAHKNVGEIEPCRLSQRRSI
jgi:hypothetical protein